MLRNSEQIKEYLAERRRIKENQQKQLKLKKAKENKIKARENYKLKKQEANTLKINKLQEIYKIVGKIAQLHKNKTKELITSTTYTVYNKPTRERETNEDELYTKYELQHIEELYPNETGRINWDIWDKLVNKKLY